MALGDSRRESGRQMEQARRQNGANMESQRRALDALMVAKRRGESVVEDFQRLESPPQVQRSLPPVTARGGIPAARGRAYYSDKPKMGTGGGLTPPLTEKDNTRTYFEAKSQFFTADFLLLVEIQPLESVVMIDGDDNEIPLIWKVPA